VADEGWTYGRLQMLECLNPYEDGPLVSEYKQLDAVIEAAGQKHAARSDQEIMQGTWSLETAVQDGKAVPHEPLIYVFIGKTLTMREGKGKEQKARFELDTTTTPKALIVSGPGPEPGSCAYEFDGDTLKIAMTSPDRRPKEV